jgi:hypothetical protein
VLRECATHAGSVLWAQSNMTPAFVHEVIHLFGDHISGVAKALKYSEIFEHWRNDVLISS